MDLGLDKLDLRYFLFSFSIQVNPADGENYVLMVELTFVFSMIWSVCAAVDEEGRKKIDSYLREMEGSFPNKVRAPKPSCPVFPIFLEPTHIPDPHTLLDFQPASPALFLSPVICEYFFWAGEN